MENIIPRFKRPIDSKSDPQVKVAHWEEATDAFDEKKYKKAAIETINYINPSLLEGKDTSGTIEFTQMQGSAEVQVKITDETFSIKAPFLKITNDTNKVALLRKIAEVNFTPLTLAQIHKKGNELWFEYDMPITLCQPNKVYDIIREVCIYADDYDDQFIENYKASFYKEPKKTNLTDAEKDEVWKQISNVFEDFNNYIAFLKEKRWDDFIWDIIVISLLKLSNMTYINGSLRTDLIEYVGNLFNGNINFQYRVDKGMNFMKKLVDTPKEDIMKNVYHADLFYSLRWRSSAQIISDRLKGNLEQVQKYEKEESYFNLSYYLQFILLKLIYDYNLEDDYKNVIYTALEKAAGLSPTDAAPILSKAYYDLYNKNVNKVEENKSSKKGFFSKLFG